MSLPSLDFSLHVATAVLESLLLTWYSLWTCSYLLSWNFMKASFSQPLWLTTMFHFQCTCYISVLRHNRNRASSNDTQPQPPLNMHAAGTEHSIIKRCAPKNRPWKVASASPLWWAEHHLPQRRPYLPHYPLLLYAEGDQCRDPYRQHSVCSPDSQSQKQNASTKLKHDTLTTVTTATLVTYAANLARQVSRA